MDRLLPRRPSREIEVAWALAIGFVLNGVVLVASAQADVETVAVAVANSYAFAGGLGGLTLALIHFVGQAFSSPQVDRTRVIRAAVEGVCSVIVGSIIAHYFTRYVALWVPRTDPADLLWLAYAIGVFAWRAMPLFIEQLPKVIGGFGEGLRSTLIRWGGGTP